jgi:hypothetical protein
MLQNLRLVKTNELDFLVCVQNGLFGRSTDFIKQWNKGEKIVFIVNEDIAGVAEVVGDYYMDDKPLWIRDENQHRIAVTFSHIFSEKNRPSFSKHKDELRKFYGRTWGNVFVLRKQLPSHIVKSIMNSVGSHKSDNSVIKNINAQLLCAIENEKENAIEQYNKIKEKSSLSEEEKDLTYEEKRDRLVYLLLSFVRSDPTRMEILNKESFVSTLSDEYRDYLCDVGYAAVRSKTLSTMMDIGLYREVNTPYGPGTYVIVSDSHGDHTRDGMFRLLSSVNEYINPDKVFHLGHIHDDNGIINRNLANIKNLVVVTRIEEAPRVEKFWKDNDKSFDVVRDGVLLGSITVTNQDVVSDNMSTRSASPAVRKTQYRQTFIMAHHLHEVDAVQCDDENRILTAYTGCLCEKHVASIVRAGKSSDKWSIEKLLENPVWNNRPHRLKWANKENWEQGLFVVHVKEDGRYTIIACKIQCVNIDGRDQYTTSYFDKIICEDGILAPDVKTFVNADLHIPLVDHRVLDVQNQIVADYMPDIFVNLGDTMNSEGVNHHKLTKREVVTAPIIKEAEMVHHILKKMSKWAPEKYLLFGNHERFARDFISNFPQFKGLIEFEIMSGYDRLGYKLIDLQEKLELGDVVYIHGDMLRGRSTGPLDSLAGAFPGKTVVCGHHHYSSARKGCYAIAQTGLRDQLYNEGTITRWSHGFGLCNEINGVSFVTTLIIEDYCITINNKTYESTKEDFWKNFKYNISIDYAPILEDSDEDSC